MKAIAVLDKNRAIGKDGKLLFHIPSDLKHFKKETLQRTCIMGRKTLGSMPKGRPLPGRNTLVLSASLPEGLIWMTNNFYARSFRTPESLLAWAKAHCGEDELIVCGGEQIYRLFFGMTDELILTELENEAPEADAFFPEYADAFTAVSDSGRITEGELNYHIRRYRRKHVEER